MKPQVLGVNHRKKKSLKAPPPSFCETLLHLDLLLRRLKLTGRPLKIETSLCLFGRGYLSFREEKNAWKSFMDIFSPNKWCISWWCSSHGIPFLQELYIYLNPSSGSYTNHTNLLGLLLYWTDLQIVVWDGWVKRQNWWSLWKVSYWGDWKTTETGRQ